MKHATEPLPAALGTLLQRYEHACSAGKAARLPSGQETQTLELLALGYVDRVGDRAVRVTDAGRDRLETDRQIRRVRGVAQYAATQSA